MIRRREFLISCQAAAVAALLPSVPQADATEKNSASLPSALSKAKFTAMLNKTFRLFRGRQALFDVKLVQIQDGPPRHTHEEFTVVFENDSATPLAQGIYRLRHAATGTFQLYLEPAGASASTNRCKATLSLLV